MEQLEIAVKVVSLLSGLIGVIAFCYKIWKAIKDAKDGQMCLMRQKMLDIYYANRDRKVLREYEAENFTLMYNAYKAMGGNSFIDEVHDHVTTWELEP